MAIYFVDLSVVRLYVIDNRYDFATCVVEFLQIWCFFHQLAPEFFVELGRLDHSFLAERHMIVESDYLDEIALFLFVFFEFFFDYLFEAINNELLDKRRRCSFCKHEFLVGLGVHLEPLHIKEGKADVKASAARKLLDPLFVHPFELDNKQFAILIHLRKQFFLLWLLNLDRAIIFDTSFNMFFYVANQQHIGIFIVMTVMNQQQNIL